jgi:hypothetical protein
MKSEMPRKVDAASVIEPGPRLQQPKHLRRPAEHSATVIVLPPGGKVLPGQGTEPAAAPTVGDRMRSLLARLIARIELTDFPGSCCG